MITYQELVAIQVQWHRDFIFDHSVSEAFKEIFQEDAGIEAQEKDQLEADLLRSVFKDSPEQGLLVQQMLQVHSERSMMARKVNLKTGLESLIDEYCLPKITKHYKDEN